MRPAVFLDRDGTVIEQVHHLTDPGDVRLIHGAAEAIRMLRSRGYACVVVTNQSVIGRGMLTLEGLEHVHSEMRAQLAKEQASLDAIYYCPYVPTVEDQAIVEHPDRKPGPGMLVRAARDLDLALDRSWMVGDSVGDLLAGRNACCKATVLVRTGYGGGVPQDHHAVDYTAANLLEAARLIINSDAQAFESTDGSSSSVCKGND